MTDAMTFPAAMAAIVCGVVVSGCAGRSGALTLHPASAMVRIGGPGGVPAPPQAGRYELELAGNESEALQVLVRRRGADGGAGETARVDIDIQALAARPGGPMFRVYQVLDVHHTGPAEHPRFKVPTRNVGWVPDVCLPTHRAVAQAHRPDEVTFLLDVYAGRWAVAGDWRYRVCFRHANADAAAAVLDLTVHVRPFALPVPLPFKTAVTWNWGIQKYLGRALTPAERLAYLDFFLRHRFTPASFWSVGPDMSAVEIEHVVANGGNVFQVYGRGGKRPLTDKQKADLAPKLRQWRATMTQARALDCCYALIADEPADDEIPVIRANAEWLKGVFPELRIWVATRPRKELMDVVDCWDVVTAASTPLYQPHCFTPEGLAMARQAPRRPEYWWFYSVEPYAPHPNARIDNALVDSRAIGWMSFAAGVDGFEYFWATDWSANADLRDLPWPAKAGRWRLGLSGAGQLCYPGDDGLPIPSLRLINLRDGMEDWAAFARAGDRLRAGAPEDVRDPAGLAQLRRKVYGLLSGGVEDTPSTRSVGRPLSRGGASSL